LAPGADHARETLRRCIVPTGEDNADTTVHIGENSPENVAYKLFLHVVQSEDKGLGCPNLVGVDFGARADRTDASDAAARYANKRAEMWGFMKQWLKAGSLPDEVRHRARSECDRGCVKTPSELES
jgi:hypothetical protein